MPPYWQRIGFLVFCIGLLALTNQLTLPDISLGE